MPTIEINDGDAQRSKVTRIKVTLDDSTVIVIENAAGLAMIVDGRHQIIVGDSDPVEFTCLRGDADGNSGVDIDDMSEFRASNPSALGDENYRSEFDFDENGLIDTADLNVAQANYGKSV